MTLVGQRVGGREELTAVAAAARPYAAIVGGRPPRPAVRGRGRASAGTAWPAPRRAPTGRGTPPASARPPPAGGRRRRAPRGPARRWWSARCGPRDSIRVLLRWCGSVDAHGQPAAGDADPQQFAVGDLGRVAHQGAVVPLDDGVAALAAWRRGRGRRPGRGRARGRARRPRRGGRAVRRARVRRARTSSSRPCSSRSGEASTGRVRTDSSQRYCCSSRAVSRCGRGHAGPRRAVAARRSRARSAARHRWGWPRAGRRRGRTGSVGSWPTAVTTGVLHAEIARTRVSSEKGSRSSTQPPPRAITMTSTSGWASRRAGLDDLRRGVAVPARRCCTSRTAPPASAMAVTVDVVFGRALAPGDEADHGRQERQRALAAASNRPSASSRRRKRSMRASSSPRPTARISVARNENEPRATKKPGLARTMTRAPSVSSAPGARRRRDGR